MVDEAARRLFIAVDLTDDVRHGLAAHLRAALGHAPVPGRPVVPANWHITLRFLGNSTEWQCETVLAGLTETELGRPFTLSFSGLGAFPRPARATVLWLGVAEGSSALTGLASVIEDVVGSAGFVPEDRPFHPHLTLSRLRPPQDVGRVINSVAPFPLRQQVNGMTIFRSHLGGGPARYEPIEVVPLG